MGLFTDERFVEDPVGSDPHVGHTQIGRFYDTFIGPRQIMFHRDVDIVSGTTVVRDLTLEIQMGPDVRLMVPTFIRYDLQAAESGWQIASLRAYWELPVMVTEFLHHGLKSVPVSLASCAPRCCAIRVFREPRDTSRRFVGRAGSGKRLVEQALSDGQLRDDLRNCQWRKVIAAGNTVAASVTTPSGRGVVFAEMEHGAIRDVSCSRGTRPLQVEGEAFAGTGARHTGQHHPGVAFGLGEQRVAVLDVAAENLRSAGAAESLLA